MEWDNAWAGLWGGICYAITIFIIFLRYKIIRHSSREVSELFIEGELADWIFVHLMLMFLGALLGFFVGGYMTCFLAKSLFAADLPRQGIAFVIGIAAVRIITWLHNSITVHLKNGPPPNNLNDGPDLFSSGN